MRKTLLGALIASAFAVTGTAHAGLTFDLNGSGAGGVIQADAFDWAQTSFLAKGGNTAIAAFTSGACATNPTACQFDVLTHAKLTAYTPSGGGSATGIPAGFGEITMVARYTEKVVSATGGQFPSAVFQSTGAGWLEFYWSPNADAVDLTGANFNNGRLIGRLTGVTIGSTGNFTVTNTSPVTLDGFNGNDYGTQQTITGIGSQGVLKAGTTGVDLDTSFFVTLLKDFSLEYNNISIGLPYNTVNPSDCFNQNQSAAAVGTSNLATQCTDNHVANTAYSGQGADGGYLPVIGGVNGLGLQSPDFIAQTDFNSSVNGSIPEPASLALVGLALASAGAAAVRRRKA